MNILFLSNWYPFPANNGSKLRIFNLIKGLSAWHDIYLVSFFEEFDLANKNNAKNEFCKEIIVIPQRRFNPTALKSIVGFLHTTPRSIIETYSPEYARAIQSTLEKIKIDLVIASQIKTAAYHRHFHNIPAIFDEIEFGILYQNVLQAKSVAGKLRHVLTKGKLKSYLYRLAKNYAACTVVSANEKEFLKGVAPDEKIEIIPNCVEVDNYVPFHSTKKRYLVFTGSFRYSVNYEGMVWFLGEVYPHISKQVPDVEVVCTGDHQGLPLPNANRIMLTGHLEDIRSLVAGAAVSIAPILKGGGTRLKILEAMALKTVVVSTSIGAEGLGIQHDKTIWLGDTPQNFADGVIRLIGDQQKNMAMREAAFSLVYNENNWRNTIPKINGLISRVLARTSRI